MPLARLKRIFAETLGSPADIGPQHLELLKDPLSPLSALEIIREALDDEAWLSEIAARSYEHVMGFKKIILLDEKTPGQAYQLRLHIWNPAEETPKRYYLEMRHRHGFNFISRVLSGSFENQCYEERPLTDGQSEILTRLRHELAGIPAGDITVADDCLETLAAHDLSKIGSSQTTDLSLPDALSAKTLAGHKLGLSAEEVELLLHVQEFHGAASRARKPGSYAHVHMGDTSLEPLSVIRLNAGDIYYHPNSAVHRLYNNGGQPMSTLLLTTPATDGAIDGSFGRVTFVRDDVKNFFRRMYSPGELREILTAYCSFLEAQKPTQRGTAWIVPRR